MFVQIKEFDIEKDHVDAFSDQWATRKPTIEGLVKINVLRDARKDRAVQKVIVQLYWESKANFKAWQVHPDHIAGHKEKKERPAWIVKSATSGYHLCDA